MPIKAYRCALCDALNETGFSIALSSETCTFTFGEQQGQHTIRFEMCEDCIGKIPEVITNALHKTTNGYSGNVERKSSVNDS